MRMSARYLYLNRSGLWPDFRWEGLERSADGLLRLESLPAPTSPLPDGLASRPGASGPSGLAVAPGGDIYWTDPDSGRLLRLDGCSGRVDLIPCAGGLSHPRGLLYHEGLGRLIVADSGADRLLVYDPKTWQVTDVWGAADPSEPDDPGLLRDPQGLARDGAGNVYVADHGNGLVRKFDPRGAEEPAFASRQARHPWHPTAIAVSGGAAGAETICALDPKARIVQTFAPDGTRLGTISLHDNPSPIGLAAGDGGTLYVGDGRRGRIQKYRIASGRVRAFIGEAHYQGPVAALASDGRDGLLVLPDASGPIRLAIAGGRATIGHLWGGPFRDPTLVAESWHRLRAEGPASPPGSEQTLFLRRERGEIPAPAPPWSAGEVHRVRPLCDAQQAAPPAPLEAGVWYRAPRNATECLFPGTPGEVLWVAAEFAGDGDATPEFSQLRIDFEYEELADRLPDCYFDDIPTRGVVSRLVGLFGGLFEDASAAIGRLPSRFDPESAPPGDLGRLAALVGLHASPEAPAKALRGAIAGAAAANAARGTTRGLVAALRRELGVEAFVAEPIREARCWVLPGDCGPGDAPDGSQGVGSILGVTSALAAGEPQGAVVGSTLTLDQVQLINDAEFGLPLFGEVAHRLVVRVRRPPGAGPEFLASVRELLDREVPCHVAYHVCPIEPRMSLGIQARLGVDAILAGPAAPAPLDAIADGASLVLGGQPYATLGPSNLLGRMTYLGPTTPKATPPPEVPR